jgi:hypothetical protein
MSPNAASSSPAAQVAALAGTSRTRITALINRNTKDISTDLMLRVLTAVRKVVEGTARRQKPRPSGHLSATAEQYSFDTTSVANRERARGRLDF